MLFRSPHGEWKDGEYHGQGTRTYGKGEWEGDKYEGEWKNGKRDGHGTYTWSDGGKYVGEWKSGKKHGQGTHTRSVGSKYVGKFKNGNFWNGTEYDKNGNINGKWVNSEVKDTVVEPVVPVEKRQIGVLFYRKGILNLNMFLKEIDLDSFDNKLVINYMNKPYFIPEKTTLSQQLVEFKKN